LEFRHVSLKRKGARVPLAACQRVLCSCTFILIPAHAPWGVVSSDDLQRSLKIPPLALRACAGAVTVHGPMNEK
ncbi:MAG TPA: hypothetical protein VHJ19_14060, partial [Gammaproteobacteria bacterium]|nr:hypothetical protein [Gammaproteobacteria bacterium]